MANASITISGTTHANCSSRVERRLRAAEGVVEANVELATERASARMGLSDLFVLGNDRRLRGFRPSRDRVAGSTGTSLPMPNSGGAP